MKRALAVLTFFPAVLIAADKKADWEPIPAEVWTRKDTAGKGGVILRERFHVESNEVDHVYRLRIFSEQGKALAEIPYLPEEAFDLYGRTVYPDGKEVVFDSKKDLQTKTALEVKGEKYNKKVLLPPGLSSNCVVDIRWKEKRYYPELASWGVGRMESWTWNEPFPMDLLEIDIASRMAWSWSFRHDRSGSEPEVKENKGSKTFSLHNLPAVERAPFSLPSAEGTIQVSVFAVDNSIRSASLNAPATFWDFAVKNLYKPFFEDHSFKGSDYRTLSEGLRKGLPSAPVDTAAEILTRLNSQVQNLSALTYAEKAARKTEEDKLLIHPADLNESAKRRYTNNLGMFYLAFQLMKDAGLTPVVAVVADRDVRWVNFQEKNPGQFTNFLMGIDVPGKGTFWFDPGLRYASPGLLIPDFQGTPALVMNTSDWTSRFEAMPTQPAAFNQRRYTYRVEVGEDQDTIKMEAGFSGYPEYAERSRYMRLEPKEQIRTLKELMEGFTKDITITKAEVTNATNPRKDIGWTVEGVKEREAGRRVEVYPFPLMSWPVDVPTKWPETRAEQIVFPYKQIQLAVSTIKMPKGYNWSGVPAELHKNDFGMVAWKAERKSKPNGDEIEVILRVDVNLAHGTPEMYPKLREFVGWVSDLCGRTLIVERAR